MVRIGPKSLGDAVFYLSTLTFVTQHVIFLLYDLLLFSQVVTVIFCLPIFQIIVAMISVLLVPNYPLVVIIFMITVSLQ